MHELQSREQSRPSGFGLTSILLNGVKPNCHKEHLNYLVDTLAKLGLILAQLGLIFSFRVRLGLQHWSKLAKSQFSFLVCKEAGSWVIPGL